MVRRLSIGTALLLLASTWGCGKDDEACSRNSQCPANFHCQAGQCIADVGDVGTDTGVGDTGGTTDTGVDLGQPTGIGPDGQPVFGASVGESCTTERDCRPPLSCPAGTCEPAGTSSTGVPCTIAGECGPALSCGLTARCTDMSGIEEGGACIDPTDCARGLRCDLLGLTGVCQPEGDGDLGQSCQANSACLSPLLCVQGTCQIPVVSGLSVFDGVECQPNEAENTFRVYFELPSEELPAEFFRLPFPNDIRLSENGVDLDGFPSPGPNVLGGDVIDATIDAVEGSGRAFSTNPTVTLRFSSEYAFESVDPNGDPPTLRFVNIDPDSNRYGLGVGFSAVLTNGRTNFICQNYITVRSDLHRPLQHGTTYAVYVTTGILSTNGTPAGRDADFAVVMGATEPGDPRQAAAWRAYAPFRAYLQEQGIDALTIAGAAVFTTMDPDIEIEALRTAIRARTVPPSLDNLMLCDGGEATVEACHDGAERRCLNAADNSLEVHATYRAPIWQSGTRPYLTASDGGNLVFTNGEPDSHGSEEMCVSMTIPLGEMPDDGWPVVMYAHGTGGDYLSHIRTGIAEQMASINLGEGDPVRIASVGIDGVLHGPRRGGAELDPGVLFFNFINPQSALGNVQQGAADYFYLTWLLEQVDLSAEESPTGSELRFDPANFFFYGHSQGSTVGAPFVAYESTVRSAVFSGAGASLILSLLNKTNPVDIAGAVAFVLNESTLGTDHPVLNLMQQLIDPVDAANYADRFILSPPDESPIDVFVPYGLDDTFSPDATIEAFARIADMQLADPPLRDLPGMSRIGLPVSANRRSNNVDVTAILVQYQADNYDGHFVTTRHPTAMRHVREFFGTAVRDGIPTVSP